MVDEVEDYDGPTVHVILKGNPDSWQGNPPVFKAVAEDYNAALKWITEETKKDQYAQSVPTAEWIARGYFEIREVPVYV